MVVRCNGLLAGAARTPEDENRESHRSYAEVPNEHAEIGDLGERVGSKRSYTKAEERKSKANGGRNLRLPRDWTEEERGHIHGVRVSVDRESDVPKCWGVDGSLQD